MLSNCVAGEDSEYSLEGVMLKLQYFGNLMQKASSLEKTLMLGRTGGRRRGGWQRMRWLDGITYDNGHELGQTLGDGEGQRGLVCGSPWGCKELDMTWWLDNNYKTTKHSLTSWPSNHTPLYLHKGVENLCPHKNMHTYVYSSFIFITARTLKQPTFSRWINRWTVVHPDNGILFSTKKK